MYKALITILISQFYYTISSAQYSMDLLPPTSPKSSISKHIGFTEIRIDYSSPSVKDRQILGGLLSYDEIWRAGADYATVLEISDDIFINDVVVDSGKYALFVIPHETKDWEIILNSQWKQWGAFRLDSTKTKHTFYAKFRENPPQEQLKYNIESFGFSSGQIKLTWDTFSIALDIRCSTEDQLESKLKTKLELSKLPQEQAVLHLQLAAFYEKHQIAKNLALHHILKANSLIEEGSVEWNKQYYPLDYIRGHIYYTKARILYWNNDKSAALQEIERCKALDNSYHYYNRNKETIEAWINEN